MIAINLAFKTTNTCIAISGDLHSQMHIVSEIHHDINFKPPSEKILDPLTPVICISEHVVSLKPLAISFAYIVVLYNMNSSNS